MWNIYVQWRGRRGSRHHRDIDHSVARRSLDHRRVWSRGQSRVIWGSWSRGSETIWWRNRRGGPELGDLSESRVRKNCREMEEWSKSKQQKSPTISPFLGFGFLVWSEWGFGRFRNLLLLSYWTWIFPLFSLMMIRGYCFFFLNFLQKLQKLPWNLIGITLLTTIIQFSNFIHKLKMKKRN